MSSPEIKTPTSISKSESFEMLFTARWNVPRAASHMDITNDEMEELFREFCQNNPPTHDKNGELIRH